MRIAVILFPVQYAFCLPLKQTYATIGPETEGIAFKRAVIVFIAESATLLTTRGARHRFRITRTKRGGGAVRKYRTE